MEINIRTITSCLAASALVLFVGTTPASAAVDFEASNEFTGSNSDNENEVDVDHDFDFDFDDTTDISTDFDADLDSGNNDINDNTLVGDVEFGHIAVGLSLDNSSDNNNQNDSNLEHLFGGGNNHEVSANFENRVTGSNSNNQNTLDVDSDVDIDINKEKNIDNDFDIDANSGNNDVEDNTVVDGVSGGDITLDFDIQN